MQLTTKVSQQSLTDVRKIGLGERLAYGCGDAASNVVWASIAAFMVYFFTDKAGLTAGVAGIILLTARILDGFIDVLVGILVDRTRTRFGKARPWILWMALPYGVLTVLLFSVPDFGMTSKIVYYSITYLLINIVFSFINIPYGTLNAMITQDQYQRSILNFFRMSFALVMSIVVSVGTTGFVHALGNSIGAWQKVFIIYAILSVILFMITFMFTRERVTATNGTSETTTIPLTKQVASLFKNKYLLLITGAMLMAYIINGLLGTVIYYAKYVLGDEKLNGILQLAGLLPIVIIILTLSPFVKRFGKRNCCLAGTVLMLLGNLIISLDPKGLEIVLAGTVIRSLGTAPMIACGFSMIYDTIEYNDWKTGVRSEGLVTSMAGLAGKVGSGLGAALIGWMLSGGGYVADQAVQSSSSLFAIKFGYIYLHAILAVGICILLCFYRLDKLYPQIVEELKQREQ